MTEKNQIHGKLDIKLGGVHFSGEGTQDWLASQLQKVIASAEALNRHALLSTDLTAPPAPDISGADSAFQDSLASYLKSKNAEKNQNMRFLATADWLRRRGKQNLTSGLVARTLSEFQQSRLANPSDCLNQNVRKGLCQKKNGGFFITPDGHKALGN